MSRADRRALAKLKGSPHEAEVLQLAVRLLELLAQKQAVDLEVDRIAGRLAELKHELRL